MIQIARQYETNVSHLLHAHHVLSVCVCVFVRVHVCACPYSVLKNKRRDPMDHYLVKRRLSSSLSSTPGGENLRAAKPTCVDK